jgi:pyruvate dehydrogenase E1 component alpha subunit
MTSTRRAPAKSDDVASEAAQSETIDRDLALDLYGRMKLVRVFEERTGKLFESGEIPGFLHLYVGQEASGVGCMSVLRDDDQITSTHRGHGHAVAKGADVKLMFAELYGRENGYCRGRGGSMHINDLAVGMLGANGIVGGGMPIVVGAALASQFKGRDSVSVSFFGDGASNIGAFHESANMAAVLKLPVIFVCENNGYAEYTPASKHMAVTDVAVRATSYNMPSVIVDGMDVLAVRAAMQQAVDHARAGNGPYLVETKTYRYYDHQGIKGMRIPYRSEDEVADWKLRDAIEAFRLRVVAAGAATSEELDEIDADCDQRIEEAVEFARASPLPDPADILSGVYA